ncbi:MAG TPA: GNAT family N-acetyltransferase [Chryseolinea sp.]
MEHLTIRKDEFCISTDKTKLNIDAIHQFLSTKAYWCLNIPKQTVQNAIQNSLCFGVYKDEEQIGFARIISDYATVAYLGDVFILEQYRGRGLSKWLVETVMTHPHLQGLRRWILLTADAHGLYRQFGWTEISDPGKWMQIHDKNVYSK